MSYEYGKKEIEYCATVQKERKEDGRKKNGKQG